MIVCAFIQSLHLLNLLLALLVDVNDDSSCVFDVSFSCVCYCFSQIFMFPLYFSCHGEGFLPYLIVQAA